MIKNPKPVLKRIAQICEFSEDWSFELICNQPNTAAAVYKLANTSTRQTLALKIEQGWQRKLIAEVKYLVSNSSRLPSLPRVFTQGKVGSYYFYLMEYLDGYVSFSELYKQTRLCKYHIKLVLDLLRQIEQSPSGLVSIKGIYRKHYLNRLEQRLKLLKESYLNELLAYKYIYLNGQRLENISSFWRNIAPQLSAPFFNIAKPFPGDLHFEHLFINNFRQLKIIDPNGAPNLPLAYDLGKLLHSLNGGYNLFKSLDFHLQYLGKNKFELSYQFPGNKESLIKYFNEELRHRWGEDVVKTAYLSELFHFTCLIAHHLSIRKEALGFYCRTLELIERYKNRFGHAG